MSVPLEYLKCGSLILLVFQNTLIVIAGKYSSIKAKNEKFLNNSVVVMTEVVIIKCKSWKKYFLNLYKEFVQNYDKTLKIAVPSFLYVIQNNIILIALANLPVAVYQVSYQLKILTTALASVIILRKSLSKIKWLSLIILFIGVAMVNLKTSSDKKQASTNASEINPAIGIIAILTSCTTSAISGVYFELLIKSDDFDLLISNIKMSYLGVIFSLISSYAINFRTINEKGFLIGFNDFTWIYIACNAFGGLLIAVVIKYADNILKGFSTSIAIIFSTILSYFLFSFQITILFFFGAVMVIFSVILYSIG